MLRDAEFLNGQRDDFIKPLTLLTEATQKDPTFALAYCSIAHAYDALYLFGFDRTAENRALGRAAADEALRLRPNLPDAHLAVALHLIIGDENLDKAREEIAIAERVSPNSPYVFWFRASIDSRQGLWEESAKNLEKAATLEPRYPKLLLDLEMSYLAIRRFRDAEQIHDRLIELRPDDPSLKISKAYVYTLGEKGDLASYLKVVGTVPNSLEDRIDIVSSRVQAAIFDRNWIKAKEILDHSRSDEFQSMGYASAKIPRGCVEIWIARLEGAIPPPQPKFTVLRDELNRKIDKNPDDPELLSTLGLVDAALGRKEEAIQEAKHATEMLPISKDAELGPGLVTNLAIVYGWTSERALAFQELTLAVKTPNSLLYGELKLDPAWDTLRNDPRFDKLLAELAPRD
jgi:tetratricopeptide (TPR) repeat protein